MGETGAGTNGGEGGTSGEGLRRRRLLWLAAGLAGFLAIQSIANVESTVEDMAKLGVIESRVHVWTWQLTSVVVWLALMPVLGWLVARLRPPRFSWPVAILLHALATVPVSLVHVVAMVALRMLVYAAGGERYDFGPWPMTLLYEYRKDAATYLLAALFLAYAQWLLARPAPAGSNEEDVLVVSDGSVTHRVPAARIESASAAGNYVEIVWSGRTLLHRSTLASLAERLGPGFVRIHRGRIVRRAAVRSVETDKSGDFTVTLESGATLRGSRRYRGGL
ncbi:MAG: LytTR family DNA-binding domain-containing protein [Sphingomonas sp.]|uniref:LytTR family DNA-binding domain-containing protein n=1 Tax=Sphingomonas sp. TaxID=28214 RepID=UPI0022766C4E|nr:LytTR family DNA-binding domain-containing protein [Sphingomonas sp.]MCX8475288.1 LytTR family DNA-binding domain-containing protein [Sphingomonas sp.]